VRNCCDNFQMRIATGLYLDIFKDLKISNSSQARIRCVAFHFSFCRTLRTMKIRITGLAKKEINRNGFSMF